MSIEKVPEHYISHITPEYKNLKIGLLKIGSDPEVFAINKHPQHELFMDKFLSICIPPIQLIDNKTLSIQDYYNQKEKGTDQPILLREENFQWIMDGAALELIHSPVQTFQEFNFLILKAYSCITNAVQNKTTLITATPAVNFDYKKYMSDERYAHANRFGCDKDYDLFNQEYDCQIQDVSTHPFRYGGGHLHISDKYNLIGKMPKTFLNLLVIFAGNTSIAFTQLPYALKKRAEFYGKPGKYRIQTYGKDGSFSRGVEYRAISSEWIFPGKSMLRYFLWRSIHTAYFCLANPPIGKEILKNYTQLSINAIQNVDIQLAKDILYSAIDYVNSN